MSHTLRARRSTATSTRRQPALLWLLACLLLQPNFAAAAPAALALSWPELVPAEFRDDLDNSPPPPGEPDLGSDSMTALQPPSLGGVRPELDGRRVRIPGFVVPLTFDAKHRVTSFFLVPYFGACIHYPPPPPNQTIYVTTAQGFELSAVYEPFSITGVLSTRSETTELGAAEYSIRQATLAPYEQ